MRSLSNQPFEGAVHGEDITDWNRHVEERVPAARGRREGAAWCCARRCAAAVPGVLAKAGADEIGLEACGAVHHWARELGKLGHQVVLVPPQYVKPYVVRSKNDKADAEAICEAMSRPKVRERLVPIKSAEQSAGQMLIGMRTA